MKLLSRPYGQIQYNISLIFCPENQRTLTRLMCRSSSALNSSNSSSE